MGEGKTNMFGKTYNTIGSTDSNFVIKTKGDLKIQWGNKFIDLIKNGKVASSNSELLKSVSNIDQINNDGIYLITDSGELWICINGIKISLQGENTSSYVSFLVDQKSITSEQKNRALKNIGFYYDTIDEAKNANITTGIIYINNDQKLYIVNNGTISEYQIKSSSNSISNIFDSIIIGQTELYEEKGVFTINSPEINIIANNKESLTIKDDFLVKSNINIKELYYIQSYGATENQGFRLYTKNNQSFLEVDNIIERNSNSNSLNSFDIYGEVNNIIISSENYDASHIKCNLKYINQFKENQEVYIYIDNTIMITTSYSENTIEITSSEPVQELTQIQFTINDISEVIITIQNGEYYGSIQISENITSISNPKVIQGSKSICFSTNYKSKKIPYKYIISSIGDNYIIIPNTDSNFSSKFLNTLISSANRPYIKLENNTIQLVENEHPNTQIGIINEEEIEELKQCQSQIQSLETGIYSNNFIGLNSKLYDTVFKKRCSYPKYDESIELPDNINDEQYNQVIPNINWIKELIKFIIPSGTIVMYNGKSDIPEGWVVCDGNNGTPNLVGKFIKAVSNPDDIGDNSTDLNSSNELIIKEENLPAHSHPHSPHTHNVTLSENTENSGDLDMSSTNTFAYNLSKTSVVSSITGVEGLDINTEDVYNNASYKEVISSGASHSHNISINSSTSSETSIESNKIWKNNPIKVEPHSYSLIFIMKL